MMKKGMILVFFVFAILAFGFFIVTGQSQNASEIAGDDDKIDKAYECLENQIESKTSFSLQDAVFGTLALGNENKLKEKIEQEKKTNEACWPKAGCTIKDSAQVLLTLDRIGGDKEGVKNWLLSKTQNSRDLIWYLEIDIQNHEASECSLKYDSRESKIKVRDDMKLEGNPGTCFDIGYGGYWLKINNNCLDKEFEISCDKDFITALVYQKSSGQTVFVSSETHSSVSLGTTTEKVNSKCFATGTRCDYEGTLWAALALTKIGEDASANIPYLVALLSENQRYLPSAFLYILTNGEDMYNELIQNQKLGKYWDIIGGPYNRFYDSALAMLALSGTGATEFESAQDYLLSVQTKEGCWNNNNIRDTAFVLYAGWPRSGVIGGDGEGTGGGKICESEGYYCETQDDCLDSGGTILRDLECTNFRNVCCTKRFADATCDEKRGLICASNQRCTGRLEPSADGSCCLEGACENIKQENLCAISGGICKTSCSDNEESSTENCPDSGDICCIEKIIEEPEQKTGISKIWIAIFIVLILLLILGIIYRHRIQSWLYSRKGGKGAGLVRGGGPRLPPGASPGMMMPRPMPRYGPPGQRGPVRSGPMLRQTKGVKSPEDKEMEETMKKLREMSK